MLLVILLPRITHSSSEELFLFCNTPSHVWLNESFTRKLKKKKRRKKTVEIYFEELFYLKIDYFHDMIYSRVTKRDDDAKRVHLCRDD